MPTSLADFSPMTTQPRILVSPTARPVHTARPGHPGPGADQEGTARVAGVTQARVAGQGITLAECQRGHGVAVHPDNLAPTAEVAVGLLFGDEEVEPLAHGIGVSSLGMGVAGPR